jgi:hypothetical protein
VHTKAGDLIAASRVQATGLRKSANGCRPNGAATELASAVGGVNAAYAGRTRKLASIRQAGGHWFEPSTAHSKTRWKRRVFSCTRGWAAIPSSQDGTISACLKKDGNIKVIDSEAGDSCKKNEQPLSWNVQGPLGAQGEQGPPGVRGGAGGAGPTR